jgi:hypothetical protein
VFCLFIFAKDAITQLMKTIMEFTIRQETLKDYIRVYELNKVAFGQENEAELVIFLYFY